jgi:chromosomal replication initiation ATPase DnaA
VKAELHDGTLTINVADSFTASLIESDFSGMIKEAAEKALGHGVSIRVKVGGSETDESKRGKLESLSAFGIVNFE